MRFNLDAVVAAAKRGIMSAISGAGAVTTEATLAEGQVLIHRDSSLGRIECIRTPGRYSWRGAPGVHSVSVVDIGGLGRFWATASDADRKLLGAENLVCAETTPDRGVLIHYVDNEIVGVITAAGTHVFGNHNGSHMLERVSRSGECTRTQAENPVLANFTRTVVLERGCVLLKKSRSDSSGNIYTVPGEYYFWNLPDDCIETFVYACSSLEVSREFVDTAEAYRIGYGAMVRRPPARWNAYRWRYIVADGGVVRKCGKEDNDVMLWAQEAAVRNAFFQMIPHARMEVELNGQMLFTGDKASVRINCVVPFVIPDPDGFISKCPDLFFCDEAVASSLRREMHLPVQMALRDVVQGMTLEDLMEKRAGVQDAILEAIIPLEQEYAIRILGAYIRDISVGKEMQAVLNQIIAAEKKSQVRAIERRDETASNRSLINASRLLDEHPGAMALRKLQTIESICDKIQSLNLNISD